MMHHQLWLGEMNDDDEGKTFSVGGWALASRRLVSSPSRDNVFGKALKCRHACLRFTRRLTRTLHTVAEAPSRWSGKLFVVKFYERHLTVPESSKLLYAQPFHLPPCSRPWAKRFPNIFVREWQGSAPTTIYSRRASDWSRRCVY